jgi:hypothetical protein
MAARQFPWAAGMTNHFPEQEMTRDGTLLPETPFQRFLHSYRAAKHLRTFGQSKITILQRRKLVPVHVVSCLIDKCSAALGELEISTGPFHVGQQEAGHRRSYRKKPVKENCVMREGFAAEP